MRRQSTVTRKHTHARQSTRRVGNNATTHIRLMVVHSIGRFTPLIRKHTSLPSKMTIWAIGLLNTARKRARTLCYFLRSNTKLCLIYILSWISGLDNQTATLTTAKRSTTPMTDLDRWFLLPRLQGIYLKWTEGKYVRRLLENGNESEEGVRLCLREKKR